MIVLYGAGDEFVKIVKGTVIKNFDFVIDTYAQDYPQGVCGYTIYDKSKLLNLTNQDFVCITSKKYYDEIVQSIREVNDVVNVIDVYQLNWMESELPNLLRELRNRDECYQPIDDDRIKQWMKEVDDDEVEYWKKRIPEVRKNGDKRFTEREFVYPYNPELEVTEKDMILDVGAGPLPKFVMVKN